MSLFEFLMVLVSIIVGLGIAELLTGVAGLMRNRATNKGYWLHWCGITLIFFALLQNWWELWELSRNTIWNFQALVLMLISPATLYLIAHLIFPDAAATGKDTDMEHHYHNATDTVWWLAVLATASSTLFRPLAFGSELVTADNLSAAIFTIGFVSLAISKNRLLHSLLIPLFLVLLLADVFFWHPVAEQFN